MPSAASCRIALGIALAPGLLAATPVDFQTQVLPLLSEYCFNCHGPDAGTRKGGLRLDRREDALRPADSGIAAIVPGNPAASNLLVRMKSPDPAEIMPPPETKKNLPPASLDLLRRWIEQGAEYREHWAFEPIQRPEPPTITHEGRVRNPIDAFVFAELRKRQLTPSSEAPKATLLRRLSLDLTGLPPTPEELSAFLADPSPVAYEAAVDRLLASPHYGERMALPWLDAARYADSNGFQQDGDTHQYVWRDWVVRALNDNMPFDRFTIEQLAGDLLPGATLDQKIASAFNRNHLLNGEGGAIAEEQRNVILFDRVDVTATTWLGLTMSCSQCHDHKYDPMPQRDFYRMMAFFNQVPESGVPPGGGQYRIAEPWIHAGNADQMAELARLEQLAAEAEMPDAAALAEFTAWQKALAEAHPIDWTPVRPLAAVADSPVQLVIGPELDLFASGPAPDRATYRLDLPAAAVPLTALRIDLLPDPRLPKGGSGRADSGNAVLTRLRLHAGENEIPLASALADYSQAGFDPAGVLHDDPAKGWAYYPEVASPHYLIVQSAEPVPAGLPLRLTLEFQSVHVRHQFGRFRLSTTTAPAAVERLSLPAPLHESLAKTAEQCTAAEQKSLLDHFLTHSSLPATAAARARRSAAAAALQAHRESLPKVMVMSDGKARKTHIYDRGLYTAPTEEVDAGTPECLPPMKPGLPANRLGLAQWIMAPENPLTARVQVNRFWQLFFGHGIVKSAENLGVQADAPSHPALLDWLASEFRNSGWDVKHLHRLIVTSATYRQSARVSPTLLETDPENRLLARAPRPRLPAMLLRDLALGSSGLLDRRIGGKPVYPYQPPGIWDGLSITKERDFTYPQSAGGDLHRRSLYTFWRRTAAPGNMFDASPRTLCSVKPSLTNTPIHALITLNDITWNESARALALLVIRESPQHDIRAQLRRAWLRVCSREPNETELKILLRSHARAHAEFSADPAAAARYLQQGEAARELPADVDPAHIAALAAVCLSILNLDEALCRG